MDRIQHAVPEPNAGADCLFGGGFGLVDPFRVIAAELLEEFHRQGAVEVFVEMDMAVEVVVEDGRLCLGDPHVFQKLPEHARDQFFAPECQCGCDQMRLVLADEAEGGLGKIARRKRNHRRVKGLVDTLLGDQIEEAPRHLAVGADLVHGATVQLEMAGVLDPAVGERQAVGFLFEDQLVDEIAHTRVTVRHPGHRDRCDPCLEVLDQGHEVPDREDVVAHEDLKVLDTLDGAVDRMSVELFLQGSDVVQVQ